MTCGSPIVASQAIEHAGDAQAGQRPIDLDRDALPGEIVHDVQRAEAAPVRQRVDREIHRPPLQPLARRRQRHALGPRETFPSTPTHLQPGRAIDPVHPLVIHHQPFPLEQDVQASIPEARACRRVRLQPREHRGVRRVRPALIAPRRRAEPDHATRPSQTRARASAATPPPRAER